MTVAAENFIYGEGGKRRNGRRRGERREEMGSSSAPDGQES